MSSLSSVPPSVPPPVPPELPPGWYYTEDLEQEHLDARRRRRKRLLLAGAGALVLIAAVVIIGISLLIAERHYAAGVAAFGQGAYREAIAELSSAKVLGLTYRDASVLEDRARSALRVQASRQEEDRARLGEVSDALVRASVAFQQGSAADVVSALESVSAPDLRAAVRDDAGVRQATATLVEDLAAAAARSLQEAQWDKAARLAAASLVLEPSSEQAARLAARARQGQQLRTRLAEAEAAARNGEWRKALRLALAIAAARQGFPGAAALIADARDALKPKPEPTTAVPVPTPAPTSGGTSTGVSSGPPPP